MGGSLNHRLFADHLGKDVIVKIWDDLCEQSRYDHGHSYSGDIGMLRGNIEWHDALLSSRSEASDFISDNHKEKWSPPVAVSFNEEGVKFWLIGGWCRS
jgi:hypothetical protein